MPVLSSFSNTSITSTTRNEEYDEKRIVRRETNSTTRNEEYDEKRSKRTKVLIVRETRPIELLQQD